MKEIISSLISNVEFKNKKDFQTYHTVDIKKSQDLIEK